MKLRKEKHKIKLNGGMRKLNYTIFIVNYSLVCISIILAAFVVHVDVKLGILVLLLILTPLGILLSKIFITNNLKKIELEEQFFRINFYDPLTGLPNQMMFSNYLKSKIHNPSDKNKATAVMALDIDNFKNINDVMGQQVGDILLKEVSERIKHCIKNRGMAARKSGDEFLLMIFGISDSVNSIAFAEEILSTISRTYTIKGHEFFITGSIGISLYPNHGFDEEELIKNANTALSYAKEAGNGTCRLYDNEMNEKAFERIEMEGKLKNALEKQEFLIYYQPLVDIGKRKVIGMEALLRWNSHEMGMIPPSKFIPIAEKTGLIIPLGEWVLFNACSQNKKWQDEGLSDMIVSVNISPRQFEQDNFVEMVEGVLKKTGLEPKYLELEITEDVIKNLDEAVQILISLREKGIRIALDDFGTGYSSLSYLRKLPIDTIKMDKSFVWEINEGNAETAITTAVISMGHNLKLLVLAEGVETEEQLKCLENFKCDIIQGYYFSEPIPPEKFEKLFRQGEFVRECEA